MRKLSIVLIALFLLGSLGALTAAAGEGESTGPAAVKPDPAGPSPLEVAGFLVVVGLAGAAGGFATGIGSQRVNEVCLPVWWQSSSPVIFRLGFVGDTFIGVAASFAIHFVVDALTNNQLRALDAAALMRAISLGVLAGFAGIKVLTSMSESITQQLQSNNAKIMKEVKTQNRSEELLVFTENALKGIDVKAKKDPAGAMADLANAEEGIDQLLAQTPSHTRAMVVKAKLYRRRWDYAPKGADAKHYLEQAIDLLSEAIKIDPHYDRAWYNRACYRALLGKPAEAMKDIEQAIEIFFQNRVFAKGDPDLASLRKQRDWKRIVQAA